MQVLLRLGKSSLVCLHGLTFTIWLVMTDLAVHQKRLERTA